MHLPDHNLFEHAQTVQSHLQEAQKTLHHSTFAVTVEDQGELITVIMDGNYQVQELRSEGATSLSPLLTQLCLSAFNAATQKVASSSHELMLDTLKSLGLDDDSHSSQE